MGPNSSSMATPGSMTGPAWITLCQARFAVHEVVREGALGLLSRGEYHDQGVVGQPNV